MNKNGIPLNLLVEKREHANKNARLQWATGGSTASTPEISPGKIFWTLQVIRMDRPREQHRYLGSSSVSSRWAFSCIFTCEIIRIA